VPQVAGTSQACAVSAIGGWIDRWADYLESVEGKKASTRRDYVSSVRQFCSDMAVSAPAEISREAIERHAKRKRIAGAGPSRVAGSIIAIRLFCRYLVSHRELAENPAAAIATPKAYRSAMNVLTVAEVRRFLFGESEGTLPRDPEELIASAMFAVMYGGALRPFELGALRTEDLIPLEDEGGLAVIVRRGKAAHQDVYQRLGPHVSRFVDGYLQVRPQLGTGPFLFPFQGSSSMSADTVRRRFAYLLAKRPIEARSRKLVPKILRTSRCTHLLESKMPIRDVQDFMRHRSIETTMAHYAHLAKDRIGRMLAKHDPFTKRRRVALPIGGAMKALVDGLGGS
jgi:integrase/recombinase XerC